MLVLSTMTIMFPFEMTGCGLSWFSYKSICRKRRSPKEELVNPEARLSGTLVKVARRALL